MKRIVIAGFLVLGLSFASLINTTDQVNNKNTALGGNPAAVAYEKTQDVKAGITGLRLFGESQSKLGNVNDAGKSKGTMQTDLLLFKDIELSGRTVIMKDIWVQAGLENTSIMTDYFTAKVDGTDGKEKYTKTAYIAGTKLFGNAGLDLNKYVKGLYAGAQLAFNSANQYEKLSVNKALKDSSGLDKSSAELTTATPWYTSLAFGAIYDFNKDFTFTAGQTFSAAKNWDLSGQRNIQNEKENTQYNEEIQPETAFGVIYKLSNDINIGGTVTQVWGKEYTEVRSAADANGGLNSGSTYSEIEINKLSYRKFTLNGEYKLGSIAGVKALKDVTLQGYYGWAKDAGRILNDVKRTANIEGTNDTYMGINASTKITNDLTLLVGAARTVKLGVEPKNLADTTDLYVNGSYLF